MEKRIFILLALICTLYATAFAHRYENDYSSSIKTLQKAYNSSSNPIQINSGIFDPSIPVNLIPAISFPKLNADLQCDKIETMNSKVICRSTWHEKQCEISCFDGYYMHTAVGEETSLTFVCKNRVWIEKKFGIVAPEKCEPKCQPPCANGGVCISPNVCQCAPNYVGPCCDVFNVPCTSLPQMPNFSFRKCNEKKCIVTCTSGRVFPDGSTSVEMVCDNGDWKVSNSAWDSIPDCQAICRPPCLNGGKCIDTDTCMCSEEFRGPSCQYSANDCDPSKLNFNGMYNCSGNDEMISCHVWCPPNMRPNQPFKSAYTCLYSEGVFGPSVIPQCETGISEKDDLRVDVQQLIESGNANSCMLWNSQVKMLNDKILSFKSNCVFTVFEDNVDHLFHIQVMFRDDSIKKIMIFINNMEYILSKNDDGRPSLMLSSTGQKLSIPSQLIDLKVEIASGNSIAIYLPSIETYVVWNLEDELQIDTTEKYSNRSSGLCGLGNSALSTDWESHISNSVVSNFGDKCEREIEPVSKPTDQEISMGKIFSQQFISEELFQPCIEKMPIAEFTAALEWSFYHCAKKTRKDCVCQFYSKFVQLCSQVIPELKVDWRASLNCSYECPANKIYSSCVPISQATCTSQEVAPIALRKYCEEGCICAPGTVLHEGTCISKDVCPCLYGGKFYEPKSVIPKDCNKCSCSGGKWICTEEICRAECLIFGDPHYRTFDGKKYDFSGTCSYKLVVTDDVTIETVNGVCNKCSRKKVPITTKSVIIRTGKNVIKLKDNRVIINKEELEHLPHIMDDNTYIRYASSLVIQVSLPNGLDVMWNGKNKIQIFANASLFGKTKGLCGTFNQNQQDDLLTPDNDIEKNIPAFANKWRSSEKCDAEKEFYDGSNACEVFVQNKAMAELYCKNLTSSVFKDCHSAIDPTVFYEDCLNDMCSCRDNDLSECFCPILTAYAQECARVGIIMNWRNTVRACGIYCSNGLRYEPCGSSCQRSCADISHGEICRGTCMEGCFCPPGQALNEFDECIPIKRCPCWSHGRKYPAGYMDVRNHTEAWECRNAVMEQITVTKEELEKLQEHFTCKSSNMEYVDCEPPEPTTCRNMHNPPKYSAKICHGGCICKKGFVWEPILKKCIEPVECPCHHGGRSYIDQEKIEEDCNTCTCIKGKWQCTEIDCNAVCSTWGDSHFRTFDGRYFDFQGTCDYVFVKGKLADVGLFSVAIEVVPCGTGGTSCTQSVTVTAGDETQTESLFLAPERGSDLSKEYKRFDIILTGLNVIVVLKDYKVTLFWDKSTRVSVQVNPIWKFQVSGLCGNYNGNAEDDFQSPSGGLVEALPDVFADSWKLQQHCPFPGKILNPCVINPQRKFWSVLKCSTLKDNPVFQKCHAQVPVEDFYKRCVFDACACDQGGDCECLCTSFAAYAQECNAKGVTLQWRRQDLCPIQCDNGGKYSPSVSSCPEKTCENLYNFQESCKNIACVEGCEKVLCPDQKVLLNSTSRECISPKLCPCMIINGTVYYEQQEISKDDCHSCICINGESKCMGVPCQLTTPPVSVSTAPTPPSSCTTGWSGWASVELSESIKLSKEKIAYLPTSSKVNCGPSEIVGLQCRAIINNHLEPEEVSCSFENIIKPPKYCADFQIRFRCECQREYEETATFLSTLLPYGTTPEPLCRVRCGDLCHYLLKSLEDQGKCLSVEDCIDDEMNTTCAEGQKFRDATVCVKPEDCTCMSKNKTLVRPSVYLKESSDCSICQCFKNQYDCSLGKCRTPATTVKPIVTTTEEPEPTPPPVTELLPPCSPKKLVPIDQNATYKASSSYIGYEPKFAKLQTAAGRLKNMQAWKAGDAESGHYLEVDLGSRLPVYAIEIAGCPDKYEYVKSFKLQYSNDGVTFYSAYSSAGSKIFGGCFDPRIPQKQILKEAVEARYLRVKPITWQNGITMLINVLGCKSKIFLKRPCMQRMGIESGQLLPNQVDVSSTLNDDFHPHDLSINSATGWTPLIASANEYVEFNFYGNREIDGIVTKGGTNPLLPEESWVEAYKVRYSNDGKQWMTLDEDFKEKIFPANFDHFSPYLNTFSPPINAYLLRIYPVKWHNYPTLRVELMGCFKPYDNVPPPPPPPPPNVCNGVKIGSETCRNQLYWNGTHCVDKEFCPCVVGLFTHEVGAVFFKDTCTKCTCSLGGESSCEEITNDCSTCIRQGMLYSIDEKCNCECSPCPNGTMLCQSSNVCINKSSWCDDKQDCSDDEKDCVDVEKTTINKNLNFSIISLPPITTPAPPRFCPIPSCADVYTAKIIPGITQPINFGQLKWTNVKINDKKIAAERLIKLLTTNETDIREFSNEAKEYQLLRAKQSAEFQGVCCDAWECEPGDTCPEKPQCPFGTRIRSNQKQGNCLKYECIPASPTERECSVNGQQIVTFDGLVYMYDTCDHVLAQDKFKTWRVRKINKCVDGLCDTSLVLNHFNDEIQFFTNFTILFNGFTFTVPQLNAIGEKTELFVVERVTTKFIIFSSLELTFSVIWGSLGTTKIIVNSGLHHMVDGLCGHFDFNVENDKMTPDGNIAIFTEEFGDSWKFGNGTCQVNVCPPHVQKKAREICGGLKKSPFDVCDFTLNIDVEISKCIASICTCAAHATNFDSECRCSTFENFAVRCSTQQPGADLTMWRAKHNCAMNCTAPLVYQECFNRHCEPSCSSLQGKDECPPIANRCYSGCYCPSGLIREGDRCIKPNECRDAVCNFNSLHELTTFDQVQLPFDEFCGSFILLQTKSTEILEAELKIIGTQIDCQDGNKFFKCLGMLSIFIDKKEIVLYQVKSDTVVSVDNVNVTIFPYEDEVIKITEVCGVSVTISVPSIMLDLTFMRHFKGFSIRLPAYMYSKNLRGLCGTCNHNQSDDINDSSGSMITQPSSLLNTWETEMPADVERFCTPLERHVLPLECSVPTNDVCKLLEDKNTFGKCNLIVDPAPYVAKCRAAVCNEGSHCYILAAYAEECYKNGLCVSWRNANRCPYYCPTGTQYEACGSTCQATCDNYEYMENDLSCAKPFMERCGCSPGQVLLNSTCIEQIKCKPCDEFGHYVGDKWKPDDCTQCECTIDRRINCNKKECTSEIVCPVGTQKAVDKNNDDLCCEKFICEPNVQIECPPLVEISCGQFQEKQLSVLPNNCTQYICSCIAKENCPALNDKDVELLPGMNQTLKTNGCCPQYELECIVNTCPSAPACNKFEKLVETKKPGHCCSYFECQPPQSACIYEYQWIVDSNGTERRRLPTEATIELKQLGESWLDGVCHECVCRNETNKGLCARIKCSLQPENDKYVMETVYNPEECCPAYVTVACKVNGVQLPVNQSIPVENEPCKTIKCIVNEKTGEISRQDVVERCKTRCSPGWEYRESSDTSVCCGSCKQTACVDSLGMIHTPGSTWNSTDNCTRYECDSEFKIIGFSETCPNIDDCGEDYIYDDGCCQRCNITALSSSTCTPQSIKPNETIGIISKQLPGDKNCTNVKAILGLRACLGTCPNNKYFDPGTFKMASTCGCCTGVKFKSKIVKLTCDDGLTINQMIEIPTSCSCLGCASAASANGI